MNLIKFITLCVLIYISACTRLFPDKEKDYALSVEIPALKIPPHMQDEKLQATAFIAPMALNKAIEYIDRGENNTYVHINSPYARVWRLVGKALTKRAIEITDKNRSIATYYVQYDPDIKAVSDGTFWDELVFFFGSDANQELPYQVFLMATELGTDVFIRDKLGNRLSQGHGIKLLNLIFTTIKEDFDSTP